MEYKKNNSLYLKDKKILFELDFNARIPYSQLAKKVRLSKQGTEYRINRLLEKGIIKGFYPVINVPKLGYIYCRLMITLQNTTKEKQKEILNFLTKHDKVFWMYELQGIYDIGLAQWAKSVTEFKEFVDEIGNKFGEYIKKKTESIATDVIHFQQRYLLKINKTEEIHIKDTETRVNIDSTDKKILSALCNDARIPLIDISRKIKESAKVVAYRIKKLEKIGIIEGYRPIIDHNKIGYTYYKLLITLNRFSKEDIIKLKSYIKSNTLVLYIVEGIGLPGDLDIEIMVDSNQQMFNFINDLKFKFPALIGEYQTIVFMDTLKVRYLPF